MQSVILAAGKGTRMGELTKNTPKPMLRVLGKPLLEHHLNFLPDTIDEVIFVIGYLGEQIRDYFGDEWQGRRIRYVEHEKLDGTAMAVRSAQSLVRGKFLVTMGDDLYGRADIERLIQQEYGLLALPVTDAERFGIVTTDELGNLAVVVERPHGFATGLVNIGAYVLDERFFAYEPVAISETEYGLPQTLAVLAKDIPVAVVEATRWQSVGQPSDLPFAEDFLK